MESSPRQDPSGAHAALSAAEDAREGVAARSAAPWWYHAEMGLAVSLLFASFALPADARTIGVPLAGSCCRPR